jgi:hypothetical protein
VIFDTEGAAVADLDRRTRTELNERDRAWTGLDHETAVRMSGRAYRPGKVYDRPQLSERPAGKPGDRAGENS